ncbi:DUF4372 domain-containing protein [Tunturiibacter gelidiferens]|uniref:DUF4372 domain-containing protein n=1 Tax=Tunturiibacter gelidiferens TaxID=3069689 RepID=UPI003D9ADA8F
MTRVSSIFSQMLQLFSRHEFEQAVREHRADRHARGFTCWGQYSSIWILLPVCSAAHALEFLGGTPLNGRVGRRR